jgi:oligoribonuclease NrnB/cAMP/cGMP phosphodiesterase (DHH superfamily)
MKKNKIYFIHYETTILSTTITFNTIISQEIALVKYSGGGDWYANPTSLPNLIKYCNANINTRIKNKTNNG